MLLSGIDPSCLQTTGVVAVLSFNCKCGLVSIRDNQRESGLRTANLNIRAEQKTSTIHLLAYGGKSEAGTSTVHFGTPSWLLSLRYHLVREKEEG